MIVFLAFVAMVLPAGAMGEQASLPGSTAAAQIDAGAQHTCAIDKGRVRCWGLGFSGQLGYGNKNSVGDDETPGSVGFVDLGAGRTATAVAAGDFHTCALLDDGSVRCWGFGEDGRLGYGNTPGYGNGATIGDDETPGSTGPVDLGFERTATAISAGAAHTCALLDDGTVRCWGFGGNGTNGDGRLGYGDASSVGDDETPGSVAPVSTGGTVTAITAGGEHTCALLEGGDVRCWGTNGTLFGGDGRLGYGNSLTIGDNETPDTVDPVYLGPNNVKATAIGAGGFHTCVRLTDGNVRCWGNAVDGRLGYGNLKAIGDNETPGSVGPVNLGGGPGATAVTTGDHHVCAMVGDGIVRCWGRGDDGQLGLGNEDDIGDDELPGSVGPVDLGVGRKAIAVTAGGLHTCARLDDGNVRCWGEGQYGRLGYGNEVDIGDDELPSAAGPVDLKTRASIEDANVREGNSGERQAAFTVKLSAAAGEAAMVSYATANGSARAPGDYEARSGALTFAPGETTKTIAVKVKGDAVDEPDESFAVNLSAPVNVMIADSQGRGTIADDDDPTNTVPVDTESAALRSQAARLRGLRTCLARAKRHSTREPRRARRLTGKKRKRAKRHARRHKSRLRSACLRRWGRTPGRVTGLQARTVSSTEIMLTFKAPGSDGSRQPASRNYVVKQSRRPIASARAFRRAQTLCEGSCKFPTITRIGSPLKLTVNQLRPGTTYFYAVAARDNVSRRIGPRSAAIMARTR